MPAVVKPRPECRHCGAVLAGSLSKCSRCGKRSWRNLLLPGWTRQH